MNDEPINLADRRAARESPKRSEFELVGTARCMACKHEWSARAPLGVPDLECPNCSLMQGKWRNPISPPANELMWLCKCGNDLFFVQPHGITCACCGLFTER